MTDLLAGAEPEITLAEQIRCVTREIAMREAGYKRWVKTGRMTEPKAQREIAVMKAVLATLEGLARA